MSRSRKISCFLPFESLGLVRRHSNASERESRVRLKCGCLTIGSDNLPDFQCDFARSRFIAFWFAISTVGRLDHPAILIEKMATLVRLSVHLDPSRAGAALRSLLSFAFAPASPSPSASEARLSLALQFRIPLVGLLSDQPPQWARGRGHSERHSRQTDRVLVRRLELLFRMGSTIPRGGFQSGEEMKRREKK